MPEDTTSSGAGATPTAGSPATGSTSVGATPTKMIATTLEEALARIAELEKHANNKSEEAARHGKNLSAAEKELAAYKEKERLAQEATQSEIEKMQKRTEAAEKQVQQLRQENVTKEIQLQATTRGIANVELIAPYVLQKLEYEDEKPTNLDKVLDEIVKGNPNIIKQADETPATSARIGPPATPAMNPGRSSIQSPGNTAQPGRIPRLTDPGMFKTLP